MARVFVSYRHVSPDQDLAAELTNFLTQNNISFFADTRIMVGQKWVEVIDRELRACEFLVVFLSSDSIRSDMVRKEVAVAHETKKTIFPIRINYDGALPYDLASYLDPIQYKSWRTGEDFQIICGAILDGTRGDWRPEHFQPSAETLRRLGEATELQGAPLPAADPRLD